MEYYPLNVIVAQGFVDLWHPSDNSVVNNQARFQDSLLVNRNIIAKVQRSKID